MFLAPDISTTTLRTHLSDGAAGVFETLRLMRALVDAYKTDPVIRQTAISVAFLTPAHDEAGEMEALFSFVRDNIRYTKDVYNIETLSTPLKVLQMRVGDCDDMTVLLASLLEAIGYPTRFVIEGYADFDTWQHVYLEACLQGTWVALDPTEQVAMGWAPDDALIRWVE